MAKIGSKGQNQMVGMKIAKQKSSGGPKDGNFRDVSPVKENPGCPYSNPAKAKGLIIPQK